MRTWLKSIGSSEIPLTGPPFYGKWDGDHIGFRRPGKPSICIGDHLYLYAPGGSRRIFALTEAISDPQRRKEGDCVWSLGVKSLINLPVASGILIDEVSCGQRKIPLTKAIPRQSHIELFRDEWQPIHSKLLECQSINSKLLCNNIRCSNTRIMRRCGQLGIPYEEAIRSLYFSSQGLKPDDLKIQHKDGLLNTVGWSKNQRPITEKDTTPYSIDALHDLLKSEMARTRVWIFQGNPKRFSVDDYLARYSYVYWSVPRFRKSINSGDVAYLWRSGDEAGAIAVGKIVEAPRPISEIQFPEYLGVDLWRTGDEEPSDFKVGIQIDEVRLNEEEGFISRAICVGHPTLGESSIIKVPQGSVFKLTNDEADSMAALWQLSEDAQNGTLPSALEGTRMLKQHYQRERSRFLIQEKKRAFKEEHKKVYCEICKFDFCATYPQQLGDGFIEVHHLIPVSKLDEARRTTLDDLLLVCSNCHRMIHRTGAIDENLQCLRNHFNSMS